MFILSFILAIAYAICTLCSGMILTGDSFVFFLVCGLSCWVRMDLEWQRSTLLGAHEVATVGFKLLRFPSWLVESRYALLVIW